MTLTTDINIMVDCKIMDKKVNLYLREDTFFMKLFKRVNNI